MTQISKPWAYAAIVWIGVIFFSSTSLAQAWAEKCYSFFTGQLSSPHPSPSLPFLLADKGFHVMLFCLLALLLCEAFVLVPRKPLVVVLAGAVIGSCSEYLQSFFPGRDPAIRDVCINIGGTVLGLLLHSFLLQPRFSLKREAVRTASTDL